MPIDLESTSSPDLFADAYDDLYRIASRYLGRERVDHTLQATGLVHEAYVRMTRSKKVDWENQAQLVGFAARQMRQILLNYAKARSTLKRSGRPRPALEIDAGLGSERKLDLIDLDEALETLSRLSPRLAQVVELRFFGGLTANEVARVLGATTRTVERDWSMARSWLHRKLKG